MKMKAARFPPKSVTTRLHGDSSHCCENLKFQLPTHQQKIKLLYHWYCKKKSWKVKILSSAIEAWGTNTQGITTDNLKQSHMCIFGFILPSRKGNLRMSLILIIMLFLNENVLYYEKSTVI
jgi:hypothetical protein